MSAPLSDGYHDVPPGKIAAAVTYLEMREPPAALSLAPPAAGYAVERVAKPDRDRYLRLFHAVGANWLWWGRLRLSPEDLTAAIQHPQDDVCILTVDGEDKGLSELDRRNPDEVEILYFGLTGDMIGRGAGRFLMAHLLQVAWGGNPKRVWLHTCTLDHHGAIGFYRHCGFRPYRRAIEVRDDPRLTGYLPPGAAPHLPIL